MSTFRGTMFSDILFNRLIASKINPTFAFSEEPIVLSPNTWTNLVSTNPLHIGGTVTRLLAMGKCDFIADTVDTDFTAYLRLKLSPPDNTEPPDTLVTRSWANIVRGYYQAEGSSVGPSGTVEVFHVYPYSGGSLPAGDYTVTLEAFIAFVGTLTPPVVGWSPKLLAVQLPTRF